MNSFKRRATYTLLDYIKKIRTKSHQKWFSQFLKPFEDTIGIEVGGPSVVFRQNILSIYKIAKSIDGVNYSNNTVWEGNIKDNKYLYYENKIGTQYILDATNLIDIKSDYYDFYISSHNLEHVANPLKALFEAHRVLKSGGTILCILPDKRFTIDRKRAYTKFDHILSDFQNKITESDLTHVEEILQYYDMDFEFDPKISRDELRTRSINNIENRCLHQHVFDFDLLKQMFTYVNFEVISYRNIEPFHKVIIGRKK